jgi:hypothetical protein
MKISFFGRLPKIDLALSNGLHVLSFVTVDEVPEWALFDQFKAPSAGYMLRKAHSESLRSSKTRCFSK